jgi:hypothetical protein
VNVIADEEVRNMSSFSMYMTGRLTNLALFAVLLGFCAAPRAYGQTTGSPRAAGSSGEKAAVIVAVDIRELTSLRDLSQVGDVFFRRVNDKYSTRADGDYDFGIEGSVAADWHALFAGQDDNRIPHVFEVEAGTYVIERIKIGSSATAIGPGYDTASHKPRFGMFAVQPGEVVNLGRLTVHMHWHEGYFAAQVTDNTADVRQFLAQSHPKLVSRLQTRLMKMTPRFPF